MDGPATDPDGDSLTYTYVWLDSAGAVVQSTAGVADLSDTLSSALTTEGSWTCQVTPFDGEDSGPMTEASVSVEAQSCDMWTVDSIGDHIMTDDGVMPTHWTAATWEGWFRTSGPAGQTCASGTVGVLMDHQLNTGDTGGNPDRQGFRLEYVAPQGITQGYFSEGLINGVEHNYPIVFDAPVYGQWTHYAITFDGSTTLGEVFVNGQSAGTVNTGLSTLITNDTFAVGSRTPCEQCGACQAESAYYEGSVDWVRVSESVLYTADFIPEVLPSVGPDTVLLWDMGSETTLLTDGAGGDQPGNISGGSNSDECVNLDVDGDGAYFGMIVMILIPLFKTCVQWQNIGLTKTAAKH